MRSSARLQVPFVTRCSWGGFFFAIVGARVTIYKIGHDQTSKPVTHLAEGPEHRDRCAEKAQGPLIKERTGDYAPGRLDQAIVSGNSLQRDLDDFAGLAGRGMQPGVQIGVLRRQFHALGTVEFEGG